MPADRTEAAYRAIMESSLFRLNGEDIDLCDALIDLCDAVNNDDTPTETLVSLGEGDECAIFDLLIGAYWALTEWHAGQWSPEYAALSAIEGIYSPGMASGPEPDSPEVDAYNACSEYFDVLVND